MCLTFTELKCIHSDEINERAKTKTWNGRKTWIQLHRNWTSCSIRIDDNINDQKRHFPNEYWLLLNLIWVSVIQCAMRMHHPANSLNRWWDFIRCRFSQLASLLIISFLTVSSTHCTNWRTSFPVEFWWMNATSIGLYICKTSIGDKPYQFT